MHVVVQGEVGIIGEKDVRARVQTCFECEGMATTLKCLRSIQEKVPDLAIYLFTYLFIYLLLFKEKLLLILKPTY